MRKRSPKILKKEDPEENGPTEKEKAASMQKRKREKREELK